MQNVPLNYNAKVSLCLSLFAMEEVYLKTDLTYFLLLHVIIHTTVVAVFSQAPYSTIPI